MTESCTNHGELFFIEKEDICWCGEYDPIEARQYNEHYVWIHSYCQNIYLAIVYKCIDCERYFIRVADNYHDERIDYLCLECS
jgi:hypothetical protein